MARASLPSDEYWQYRANLRMTQIERGTGPYLENINRTIDSVSTQIEGDIERILATYMKGGQLDREAALKLLSEPVVEKELYEIRTIVATIKDKRERAQLLARLNAPAYRARIDRLEALRLSARARLARLAEAQTAQTEIALKDAANDAFLRTMFDLQKGTGVGFGFAQATTGQIEEVLKQKWAGDHYSSRIWNNVDQIAQRVPDIIQRNLLTGRSWQRCTGEVADLVKNGGMYSAERILRTETAYVANEMEAQAYDEAGIDKYRYVATLDSRTSETCQEHDGKVYELAKRNPGTNYPPLHPNCRSTTVADFGDEELAGMQRRARDPETGKNVLIPAETTYKQWEDGLTSDGKGALQFNRKAAENKAADRKKYATHLAMVGAPAGASLEEFQHMKYKDRPEYELQKAYIREARSTEYPLPPALTYPIYKGNVTGTNWQPVDFAPNRIAKHLRDHLSDYPGLDAAGYVQKAIDLHRAPLGNGIEGFAIDSGHRFRYNNLTNDFSTAKENGVIETLYKPKKGRAYWQRKLDQYNGGQSDAPA